jgi:YD repeat-containing protein
LLPVRHRTLVTRPAVVWPLQSAPPRYSTCGDLARAPVTLPAFNGGYEADQVQLADVTGDGRVDILHRSTGQTVSVAVSLPEDLPTDGLKVLHNGFGGTTTVGYTPSSANTSGVDQVTVLLNDGTGAFPASAIFPTPGNNIRSVASADLDDDGNEDILAIGLGAGVDILLGDGAGGFSLPISLGFTGNMLFARAADFDEDSVLDVMTTNNASNTQMTIFLGDPSTTTTFAAPPGDFSTLVKNPDDSYTRTMKNGTLHEFDAAGFLTDVIMTNGQTTTYAYNANDQIEFITDPAGLITTFVYGPDDYLDKVIDPALRETLFEIDGNGDLIKITDPDATFMSYTYDARHLVQTKTSKRGFAYTYAYDFAGRHTLSTWPDTSTRQVSALEVAALVDPDHRAQQRHHRHDLRRPESAADHDRRQRRDAHLSLRRRRQHHRDRAGDRRDRVPYLR